MICNCGHSIDLHDDQAVCRALVDGKKSCQCMQYDTRAAQQPTASEPPAHDLDKCLRDLSEVWQAVTGDSPAEKCMRSCGATLEDVLDTHAPAPSEQEMGRARSGESLRGRLAAILTSMKSWSTPYNDDSANGALLATGYRTASNGWAMTLEAALKEAEQPGVTPSPTQPGIALLSKLGSIAVHAEEFLSPNAHHLDLAALRTLLEDKEVRQWIKDMGPLMPVKR
jgi:hypothetical protein